MSVNARIPIDLCDSSIKLTDALKTLHEFQEEVEQKNFPDEKRNTVYVAPFVWEMFDGHFPNTNGRILTV